MQKLVIIDGLSFFFRAYHAVRGGLTRESDGLPTNALYGFSQMLIRVVKDVQPDLCCVALDSIGNTFRHDLYPEYKAHRSEMDEEMKAQMPYFEPLINAFGVAGIRVEGMEADDIIATLATQHEADKKVIIVSSDKDLLQLLGGNVSMVDTMKNKTFDPAAVVEKFGVGPDKVIEVQALIGDSSDNIPGVPSVGPKTAAQLIDQFGDLDTLYANLPDVKRDKLREKLAENKEKAYLSKELVTLKRDVTLPDAIDLSFHPDLTCARDFLISLDFKTLAARLPNGKKAETPPAVDHEDAYMPTPRYTPETKGSPSKAVMHEAYETVTTQARLTHWLNRCQKAGVFAIDTETTNIDPMQAELVGISLAVEPNEACYIPVGHKAREEGLLAEPIPQLSKADVLAQLKPLLEDTALTKVAHNLKYDLILLRNNGLNVENFEDTMLMSAALDAGKHAHGLDLLAVQHLAHKMMSFADVAGRGQKQVTFDFVPLKEATAYAAEDADITLRLYRIFKTRFLGEEMQQVRDLYADIEKPLLPVLTEMERRGVLVDTAQLGQLSQEFATRMAHHEARIFELAGMQFNVNSPKQLGEVLFDKLKLDTGKKKATRSTNVEVMELLAEQGHDIANEVLAYRSVAKLRSTYTEALAQQVNPKTGRVHTSYNPVGAATGRMSSSDPNLQNIPIRTEDGRKIRHAFIAPQGWQMMSADYSQIELRLLAHFSKSRGLQEAFNAGEDIHKFTASRVFNVPLEEVTPEHRRVAKAVNFGLVYGMGASSLAKQVGITRLEAQEYIGRYFERYDGVKEYMETNKQFCRDNSYVETLCGRRIHLPSIQSSHGGLRAGAERAAINAPLQGSNADIIKLVMPQVEKALKDGGYKTRMLMQVHDELVFEVPDDEVESVRPLIIDLMEKVVTLDVPLKVEAGLGQNWEDAH